MKRMLLIVAVALMACQTGFAADPGTVTDSARTKIGPIERIVLTWTSGTNNYALGSTAEAVRGQLQRVVFSNGASVFGAYDVTLRDLSGLDVLGGYGADITTNNLALTVRIPGIGCSDGSVTNMRPVAVNEQLSLMVTNCASNVSGTVILYVQ